MSPQSYQHSPNSSSGDQQGRFSTPPRHPAHTVRSSPWGSKFRSRAIEAPAHGEILSEITKNPRSAQSSLICIDQNDDGILMNDFFLCTPKRFQSKQLIIEEQSDLRTVIGMEPRNAMDDDDSSAQSRSRNNTH
mmetsp:Transcript_20947/g.29106  ORF Transcript_20947/g.29106 Transcript_20947/m.29106 type:complete len:134 (-) Transcript_20947:157-558(-)